MKIVASKSCGLIRVIEKTTKTKLAVSEGVPFIRLRALALNLVVNALVSKHGSDKAALKWFYHQDKYIAKVDKALANIKEVSPPKSKKALGEGRGNPYKPRTPKDQKLLRDIKEALRGWGWLK